MSLLLAILAQVGPFPQSGTRPVSPLPPEIIERKRSERVPNPVTPLPQRLSGQLADCVVLANADPSAAANKASEWLDRASEAERAEAGQCLGMALARLERWIEAENAFREAHSSANPDDYGLRARLAAMAGNAALARGEPESALEAFDVARGEARDEGNHAIAGDIAIDRSRALVALGRQEEARDSLDEARGASPGNPQAWLLSATLSRRIGDLAMAQVQIEEAARLSPVDPEIGLEAGVIAVLAGNESAARRSWKSVVVAAPDSEAARAARAYLAQLGNEEALTP